jgi:hypothetical protein
VLDDIETHLTGKISYIRIDGKVPLEKRHENV